MRKRILLLGLPLLLVGCGYWKFHAIGDSTQLQTRMVELSGTLPALRGTPSVTLGGQPATIVGRQWTGRIMLDGAQTEVELVVLINGVPVVSRQVAIEIDRL